MQACPDDNALVAMADHALPPGQFAVIEEHIDSCDHCRKIVAAALASRSLAVGTPKPEDIEIVAEGLDVSISDRYVVQALLGKGGMGAVYLAHDRTLGRDVALKLHHRAGAASERLRREAMAMAKLAHPNVVTVFEVATVDDRLYVAMEYVRGETLRGWLTQKSRTWREIIAMLIEAGQGLAAAHAAGLIHRDFKPENILVGDDGRPRVGDFGLARVGPAPSIPIVSVEMADTALTQAGTVLGTPAYMAPEQLSGDPVDARCDQFAFSVVAWECLFGLRPFKGIDRVTRAEAPRSDVPARVRHVLERGLAIEPAGRYTDMSALLIALRKAARPKTKQWLATAVAGAAIVGTAAYVGVGAYQDRERGREHASACVVEGERAAAALSPEMQIAIRLKFLGTGSPMAASAYEHAMAVLDPFAKTLATSATHACLAPTDALTTARSQCLTSHSEHLASMASVFANANPSIVSRAAQSAWAMTELPSCEDPEALLQQRKVALADPELRHELDQAQRLRDAGQYAKELVAVTALVKKARERKDRNTELDALVAVAMDQEELENPDAAKTLLEVTALAEQLGRDTEVAGAYGSLAADAARDHQDFKAAHQYLTIARAKLDRVGGKNLAERGDLFIIEAKVFMDEYRGVEGEASARQGVALLEQALGPNNPKVGVATGTFSQLLRASNKRDEAMKMAERTLQIFQNAYGPDHPMTIGSKMNLGQSYIDAKRYDEARTLFLEADAAFDRLLGPNHPVHGQIASNLGTVEQLTQHWDAALMYFKKTLSIIEKVEGTETADAAGAHSDIARVLAQSNHQPESEAEQKRAVNILDKLGPDGDGRMIGAQIALAEILLNRNDKKDARVALQRALGIVARNPAVSDPDETKHGQELLAYAEGRGPAPK